MIKNIKNVVDWIQGNYQEKYTADTRRLAFWRAIQIRESIDMIGENKLSS